ncbi:MAG: type II toxin-antitoxin system RelE/ParE family toxin [Bacteroidaceae bacterium]|nr:type II toxin-antitoxin system RelE/ParE family toxin [Bacteroidaceae bacterium]
MLKIIIRKRALQRISSIADWYQLTMGEHAAANFVAGTYCTIRVLALNPSIGRVENRLSSANKRYFSFWAHPQYRIVYRYNSRSIYIVAIYCNIMQDGGLYK